MQQAKTDVKTCSANFYNSNVTNSDIGPHSKSST